MTTLDDIQQEAEVLWRDGQGEWPCPTVGLFTSDWKRQLTGFGYTSSQHRVFLHTKTLTDPELRCYVLAHEMGHVARHHPTKKDAIVWFLAILLLSMSVMIGLCQAFWLAALGGSIVGLYALPQAERAADLWGAQALGGYHLGDPKTGAYAMIRGMQIAMVACGKPNDSIMQDRLQNLRNRF
ncbi:M48 family metalloprotease [Acidithiobacillus ferrivorans]|uniref:M48 family metalloprotease n=1 Tax=Acidithiobacillus ferrivorans TaxID=160808 RepID=A0A7T4WCM2_9PROT|nr:M48 family metalloprotease [Acidithiobacillus ferrivorans]QQD71945.1 M48 family metalloprotease [Acidithiobacillus ferrivorans]